MTTHTKPLDTGHKPVHDAAATIVALINASPRSPRIEEIEAIIARAIGTPAAIAEPDPRLIAWRKRVADYEAAGAKQGDDPTMDAILNALEKHARALWATPVQTFADVLLRAEIAREWNRPGSVGDPDYPACEIQTGDAASIDDLALAHVVQAVLNLGGSQS